MKKVAISIGDVNGVGLEIALLAHNEIKNIIEPLYFVDFAVVKNATNRLNMPLPSDFYMQEIASFCSQNTIDAINNNTLITPSQTTKNSGEYSFVSFKNALECVSDKKADALLTLPINKFAWNLANIDFVGHTEYLRYRFKENGIMMLGCDEMFVALFTDHIPLCEVHKRIEFNAICDFLLYFKKSFRFENALVLGLNPHAGDGGILGSEDKIINEAIKCVNESLGSEVFIGAISPDSAFRVQNREKFKVFVAMYHDQGLAPLKALYAEKSINITLGIPILRVSVEHGTGFDIAYKGKAKIDSYLEAAQFIAKY